MPDATGASDALAEAPETALGPMARGASRKAAALACGAMEKVVYALVPDGASPGELAEHVLGQLAPALLAAGAHHVTANVRDAAVDRAAALRMAAGDAPAEAVVSIWVDSATDHLRRPFDHLVAAAPATFAAYLVTESVPLRDDRVPSAPGERVNGYAQVVFFRRPEGQAADEWRHRWLDLHTPLAIDTQATFSYVQGVVVRPLTPGAPPWDAIVEECFPTEAMDDPEVFFDAVGDPERLARHQREMFESVRGFIDLATIEVLPTSRWDLA